MPSACTQPDTRRDDRRTSRLRPPVTNREARVRPTLGGRTEAATSGRGMSACDRSTRTAPHLCTGSPAEL